ncbi:lysosome-associated membrane glycoprotein 3 isoform X2 [Perognathus longimembris pacificus]|uniref:lysosome-associated membrane glycoprotein 3 isoform X2 n=1 Tax=Perognathus longimembris pacificus TaxID=214514 RepID=UPI002018FA26|nr:lysosome-associated membrane glycoprotein 3 isoform X2 [Perognathus longimembris pacificus]
MPRQLPALMVIFLSLAVILHDGHQIQAQVSSETRSYLQPNPTGQAIAKPLQQPTSQVPHKISATISMDSHLTSGTAGGNFSSEVSTHTTIKVLTTTLPVTTESPPSTNPITYTLATSNHSYTASISTEATITPASVPYSHQPITSPTPTTEASPSTISHTTGQTPPPSGQTTLPKTLLTTSPQSTSYQMPNSSTPGPGTPTTTHHATQTASPPPTVPRPTLAPQPSPVKIGTYQVLNGSKLCIKAEMGIALIVQEKNLVFSPHKYFNVDPNVTQTSGKCEFRKSNLLLNFPGGSVNLTFTKEENSYYISEVGAYLTISNPEETYQGMKRAVMFETAVGHSFKCVSEQSLQLSNQLQLKTMNLQLQAFDFEGDGFGNVNECSSDYTIVLPVIGLILIALCIVGLGVYTVRLRRQLSGYQRI